MILYHRTQAAVQILAEGFRDREGTYMTETVHQGVWLSDRPLDSNEGAYGDVVLFVDIPEEVVAPYEWVQDIGYREFLIPADIVNRYSIRECAICPTCDSEHGGQSCWWCEANAAKQPCSPESPSDDEQGGEQGRDQGAVNRTSSPG